MKNIKTIVFDLYNTLVEIKESNHFFLNVYKSSQNGFGITVSRYLQIVMKHELTELKSILPSEFSLLYNEKLPNLEREIKSIILYKEVIHVLEFLKNDYRIFLISNLASPYIEPVYNFKIDKYFEKMIFSCDCNLLKPEKNIFKKIEQITANKSNEILMIGDSFKSDILGAKNMGWSFLKVNRYNPISKDYEIKNLNELKKRLKKQ